MGGYRIFSISSGPAIRALLGSVPSTAVARVSQVVRRPNQKSCRVFTQA